MREGKKIEKRKTVIKEKCLNPVYNETFMFCIPYEFIRQSSLVISVMDYDRMGRNDPIGELSNVLCFVVGCCSLVCMTMLYLIFFNVSYKVVCIKFWLHFGVELLLVQCQILKNVCFLSNK